MPIADNQKWTLDLQIAGTVSAKGSQTYHVTTAFKYRRNANSAPLTKPSIAAAFQTTLVTEFAALLNESYTMDFIRTRFMEDPTDPYMDTVPAGPPVVGGIVGDRISPSIVSFFLKKTAYRGKHYRGRMFLSPMSESDTTAATADLWNAACLTRLNALAFKMNDTFTDVDGNVWAPIVVQNSLIDKSVIPWIIPFSVIVDVVPRKSLGRLLTRAPASVY